jgi:hypothetical protein
MVVFFMDAAESLQRYQRRAAACAASWKHANDAALFCTELEEVLVFGMAVYHHINRMDEVWRLNIHRQRIAYDPKAEKRITMLYRAWLKVYTALGKILAALEEADYDVAGAQEYRAMGREIHGILTPDEKFFTSDAFLQLEADAIRAHRQGKTVEIGSLSD